MIFHFAMVLSTTGYKRADPKLPRIKLVSIRFTVKLKIIA